MKRPPRSVTLAANAYSEAVCVRDLTTAAKDGRATRKRTIEDARRARATLIFARLFASHSWCFVGRSEYADSQGRTTPERVQDFLEWNRDGWIPPKMAAYLKQNGVTT